MKICRTSQPCKFYFHLFCTCHDLLFVCFLFSFSSLVLPLVALTGVPQCSCINSPHLPLSHFDRTERCSRHSAFYGVLFCFFCLVILALVIDFYLFFILCTGHGCLVSAFLSAFDPVVVVSPGLQSVSALFILSVTVSRFWFLYFPFKDTYNFNLFGMHNFLLYSLEWSQCWFLLPHCLHHQPMVAFGKQNKTKQKKRFTIIQICFKIM